MSDAPDDGVAGEAPDDPIARGVLAVHAGHGANCSSVGSLVDVLYASAAFGGALLAGVLAALRDEPIVVVGRAEDEARDATGAEADARAGAGADDANGTERR
jgi:hypothetical protein